MGESVLGLGLGAMTGSPEGTTRPRDDAVVTELLDRATLEDRVGEIGRELAERYADRVPVLVGVLAGALPFLADLVRQMPIDLEVDFLALTRFGEGGRVRIAMDTETSLAGRHVVLVEDIVDTGLTLTVVRRLIEAREPASLATVTLFDKVPRRIVDVPLEHRGFEVGDEFLLGYGLDWEGCFRNLPSVWAVLDLPAFAQDPDVLTRAARRSPIAAGRPGPPEDDGAGEA